MLLWVLNLLFGASEAAAPSPDCFVAFVGTITDPVLDKVAFLGTITDTLALVGTIDDSEASFLGTITDTHATIGNICNE